MSSSHSFSGQVRRCSPHSYFSAAALLLVALGCNDADSPTEPGITSSSEVTSSSDVSPQFAVASNTWTLRRDMPGERFWVATAMVPNAAGQSILYAIGGSSEAGGSLSRVQAYNVATNTWSYKAPLPMPLRRLNGAGVIGGKIYVAGGNASRENDRQNLYVYDPAVNTWTEKQAMPEPGSGGYTGVIQGKLYVVTNCRYEWCFPGPFLFRYDPATNTWTELAKPPEGVGGTGGTIGNKFYLGAVWPPFQPVIHVYDPTSNTWTRRTTNRYVDGGGTSVVLGAKLYMIGGRLCKTDGSCTDNRSTNVYDPGTNRWTELAPLPTTRLGGSAARVFLNGRARIELVGGSLPGNNLQYTP